MSGNIPAVKRTEYFYKPSTNLNRGSGAVLITLGALGLLILGCTMNALQGGLMRNGPLLGSIGAKLGKAGTGALIGVSALMLTGGVTVLVLRPVRVTSFEYRKEAFTQENINKARITFIAGGARNAAVGKARDYINANLRPHLRDDEFNIVIVCSGSAQDRVIEGKKVAQLESMVTAKANDELRFFVVAFGRDRLAIEEHSENIDQLSAPSIEKATTSEKLQALVTKLNTMAPGEEWPSRNLYTRGTIFNQ